MVFGKGRSFDAKSPEKSSVNKGEFIGVDPIYQNYANSTDKPLKADKKSSAKAEDKTEASKTSDKK